MTRMWLWGVMIAEQGKVNCTIRAAMWSNVLCVGFRLSVVSARMTAAIRGLERETPDPQTALYHNQAHPFLSSAG